MTLVIGFPNNEMAVMAGDVMLSGFLSEGAAKPKNSVTLRNPSTGSSTTYIYERVQKIVRVSAEVHFAWSGTLKHAKDLLIFVRKEVERTGCLNDAKAKILGRAIFECQQKNMLSLRYLLTMAYCDKICFTGYPEQKIPIWNEDWALLAGLGSSDFIKYVETKGAWPVDQKGIANWFPGLRYVAYVLEFAAQALTRQATQGYGLDKRWGLGIEFLAAKRQGDFNKVDRVLFQAFNWDETYGHPAVFKPLGATVFHHYVGEDLVIEVQASTGARTRCVVCPPDRKRSPERTQRKLSRLPPPPKTAILICTQFVRRDGGSAKVAISADENGHAGVSISQDSGGKVSIDCSHEYLVRVFNATSLVGG